jgi:hypothetical protein
MAGTFDHHLHVMSPGFFRQLAESFQFGELGSRHSRQPASQAVARRRVKSSRHKRCMISQISSKWV